MPEEAFEQVTSSVIGLVRECARLVAQNDPIDAGRPLSELGVDSYGLVELISKIETRFGIEIPDAMLIPEVFESSRSISVMVSEVLGVVS